MDIIPAIDFPSRYLMTRIKEKKNFRQRLGWPFQNLGIVTLIEMKSKSAVATFLVCY